MNSASGRVYATTASYSSLMVLYLEEGRLHDAFSIGQRGLGWIKNLAKKTNRVYPTEAMIRINMSRVLYEWNRLSEAYTHTNVAVGIIEAAGPRIFFLYQYCLFLLQLAQGEFDQAARTCDAMSQAVTTESSLKQTAAAMILAEMAARLQDFETKKRQWLVEMDGWVNMAGL